MKRWSELLPGRWLAGRLDRRIQLRAHTGMNRYPELFRACCRHARAQGWLEAPDFRLLSYGCSSGEECVTLAGYFPTARILGVDVNQPNLARARRRYGGDEICFAPSGETALRRHGPFHMVFCLSVLCHWPEAREMDDISGAFPFARFEEALALLHGHLHPGGLLVIYNSNYRFADSQFYGAYRPLRVEGLHGSGYVHKFDPRGRKRPGDPYDEVVFEKR
jgi:hypothetical protein